MHRNTDTRSPASSMCVSVCVEDWLLWKCGTRTSSIGNIGLPFFKHKGRRGAAAKRLICSSASLTHQVAVSVCYIVCVWVCVCECLSFKPWMYKRQQQCSRQALINAHTNTQTNASQNSVSGLIIEVKVKASANTYTPTLTLTLTHSFTHSLTH